MSVSSLSLPLRFALPPRSKDVVPFLESEGLATAAFAWQFEPKVPSLVVVAKATFAIVDGALAVWCPDGDALSGDEPNEDLASLRRASDFAPFKPKVDLTLVGHAYPPRGQGEACHVGLRFGATHARLAVVGDREWSNGVPTPPKPFSRMPLVWERAFGGPAVAANPLGCGSEGRNLPNLTHPERVLRTPHDVEDPICFAPVPREFPARRSKLGTYDDVWKATRWPYFPGDFDWSYMNAAPAMLQLAAVRGDERFELAGVHPALPVVTGQLPGLRARAFALQAHDAGVVFRELALCLDTVNVDADRMRISLVWRGVVPVSHSEAPEITRFYAIVDPIDAPTTLADVFARMTVEVTARFGAEVLQPIAAPQTPAEHAKVVPPPPEVRVDPALTAAWVASGDGLVGADFAGHDLRGLDLAGRDLRGANFVGARLDGARLDGANLAGAVLVRAYAPSAQFDGADLRSANLSEAVLTAASFDGAVLDLATAAECFAAGASFVGCALAQANFTDALLDGATFERAEAPSSGFSGASARAVSFVDACLDDAQLYDLDANGAHFDRATLARVRMDGAKLTHATFHDAEATDASLDAADLEGARLDGATLSGAVLAHANLRRAVLDCVTAKSARFRGACLEAVGMRRANLMEASFDGADLRSADLRGSNLYGCDLNGATLEQAALEGALLRNTRLSST